MQTVSVRTTQNVFIEYPIASLGDRMLAFLIDAIILTAYNIIAYFIIDKADLRSDALNVIIFTAPFLLYHPLFEILMNGQSPGKRQMKIKVVNLDGSSPTIGGYLMRWLFRLVEILTLRGAPAMITIAANGKGQRIGDLAAGTTVVKLAPPQATEARHVFTLTEDGYEPVYNQVTQLSDFDIELIQEALVANRESGNIRPATVLTDKTKALLGIDTDMPPVKFLYTIVKDYSVLTSGR